jgi:Zn-dependent protease
MKGTFKLGKVAGIDLFIHWTFSLLIVFIVYINYRTGYSYSTLVSSFRFMHFVTVVMHELGHALAAKIWNTNKRHHIASIGGLARTDCLKNQQRN